MKPITVAVLSLALSSGTILFSQQCGCLHKQAVKEQMKDATTIAACIASHWGEDWTQLLAACSALGLDLFYDIVAENESNATADEVTQPATIIAPTSSTQIATPTSSAQITTAKILSLDTKAKRRSYYAKQPPIAIRLQKKDGG